MTDAISALRKHVIGLSLVRAQPGFDSLEKAAKGVEVEGHKYLMRSPDGKGGWKYSYKPPADHKKQAGAFDPVVLKQAIEQAAAEGHSAPFLLPHNGKVYLATAGGSWHSKEIKVFGHELEGDGATPDNVDFDMPRSLGSYPSYVRTRRLPGGYSEARIDQHKPATPLFTAPLPSARKKKDLEPVWHEGQWKHVASHQVPRYERETAEFKYEKSLAKGEEWPGHKYLTRKPDGKGGWDYEYPAEGSAEHEASKPDAWRPAKVEKSAPVLFIKAAKAAAVRGGEQAGHQYTERKPDGKGGWSYVYEKVKGSLAARKAKRKTKRKIEHFWNKQTVSRLRASPSTVRRVALKTTSLAYKSDAIDSLAELSKATKGDEVAGHKYLTRKPDGRGGWHYVYSHVVAGDTSHEHAREAASHSQQLAEARKDLDVASKARRESWESSHSWVFSRRAAPGLNEAMESAFAKVAKHRDAMRAAEKAAGIKPEKLRTVDVHLAIRDKDGKEIRDPEVTSMPAIGDYGITRGQYGIYHVTHIPSGYSINAGGALTSKAEAEHFVREMLHVAPKDVEFGGGSLLAESYAHGVAKQLAADEKKKSLDPLDELEAFAKGKMQHPYSEKQRRWAFAAEAEGKLPEGKALEWSHRAKGRKARARAKAKKGLKKSCSGCDPITPCASCAPDEARKSRARISHAETMRVAKRLGVEWEHARWTATDLQAGMQVELEHTKDLEKAASIALDHLCERPDYYKKLRSVEAGAKESHTTFCVRRRAMKKAFVPGQERAGHKYMRRKPDGKGGWQYFYTNVPPRTARSAQGQAAKRKPLSRSVTPQEPSEKAARVGIPGDAVLPPPGVPKLPNLTHEERAIETRFAAAFERDPNGTAQAFGEIAKKNNYVFETDGAKALLADWKRDDLPPDKPGEPMNLERAKARSLYNTALHQTANAIAKRAFVTRLDEIAKMPPGDRKILVTSGGCAAGKGVGLAARPDLPKSVAATWDAAGEQNATENEWLISECAKRGIKPTFMFVHSDPKRAWPGAVARAVGAGRMVDARVFADSYAEGAKNFSKFHEAHKDHADFVFAEVTFPGGKPNVALGDSMPDSARAINADSIYRDSMSYIEDQHRAGKIASHIYQGATAGKRIWGDT